MTEFLEGIEFWHWWVLAALLIAIEVLAPSTVLLWPGIAAGIVGLVVLAAGAIGWEFQVLLFAVLSVTSVVAWRYYARLHPARSHGPDPSRRAEQYIGRLFTLEEPIVNRRGKLRVEDTIWKIEGEDLNAGTHVRVVDVDGVILKVEQA
ncbi:MAG: NfeD family protein [Alphaproteobacteria bacterium]